MSEPACDITSYAWLEHISVGSPTEHIHSLTLFRDRVVQPSLFALDAELESLKKSDDPSAPFLVDDFAELFQRTVEGYLVAVQSMWERGLRGMLILREKRLCQGVHSKRLERVTWGGKSENLQNHFQRLMGVPLDAFDSYPDLDLLHSLGSAIRHGDGNAARRVHELCPSLWLDWLRPGDEVVAGPWRITVPRDSPKNPSFESIALPQVVLKQMIQAVLWFWDDIENMRCTSFRRKHPSVMKKLAAWGADRLQRADRRLWSPK